MGPFLNFAITLQNESVRGGVDNSPNRETASGTSHSGDASMILFDDVVQV
jgi:hypothetical protein